MIAGTTTIVRSLAGMPSRMSSFGSCRGGTWVVISRFRRLIASSLTGSSSSSATSNSSRQRRAMACRVGHEGW